MRDTKRLNSRPWLACALVCASCAAADAPMPAVQDTPSRCVARAELPQQLSQLGCFEDDDPRWLSPEVIPYEVNAPLWVDGADKQRWFAVPKNTRVELDARGDFVMPVGSVLGKTFSLDGVPVETRILMHDATGWHGHAYRWNRAGSDAELAPAAGEELTVGPNARPWTIPATAQCPTCHREETHVALGLEVAQLNDEPEDQLDRLIAAGLLDGTHPTLSDRHARPRLADYRDARQPLEARARAYLAANCSSCHTRPEELCSGDLRWFTGLPQSGTCEVAPKLLDPSWPANTRLLAPGAPERSAIVQRVSAPAGTPLAMPPIGRHGVDADGVALLSQWIASLTGCER